MQLFRLTSLTLLVGWNLLAAPHSAVAQFNLFPSRQGMAELSAEVKLDDIDSTTRAQLEQLEAQNNPDELEVAVEGWRSLAESPSHKVVSLVPGRYAPLADYAQLRLSALPAAGLALYRQRVDDLAAQLFQAGLARRDEAKLLEVVRRFYCSSSGGNALWVLGELALGRGEPGRARSYWQQLLPTPLSPIPKTLYEQALHDPDLDKGLLPLLEKAYDPRATPSRDTVPVRLNGFLSSEEALRINRFWYDRGLRPQRLVFPDGPHDEAVVRAGLVLCSIRERSWDRASLEARFFAQHFSKAQGRLAGRSGLLGEWLEQEFKRAKEEPDLAANAEWLTFAGQPDRNGKGVAPRELGTQAWTPLSIEPTAADRTSQMLFGRPVAEDPQALLATHPVVSGDLLLWAGSPAGIIRGTRLFAYDLRTGQPAWPRETLPDVLPGEIYHYSGSPPRVVQSIGQSRYTLTVANRCLFACVGSQVTTHPPDAEPTTNRLVCLDLAAEGKLLWELAPESAQWVFEGPPVVDRQRLYVAVRKSDLRPQVAVAAYALPPHDGGAPPRLLWRTTIVSAESPATGLYDELTHNLLTLHEGVVYCNSNLGAIGALEASDGRPRWIQTYPRARRVGAEQPGLPAPTHFQRDLNPCVVASGQVFAAPSDTHQILAFDAANGQLNWSSALAEDAVHLLGVGEGNLIASGKNLWWLRADGGRVVGCWPQIPSGSESLAGYGRGGLVGDKVYWPTRDRLYVFEQRIVGGLPKQVHDPISLITERKVVGGNLVFAPHRLIIASGDRIFALQEASQAKPAATAAP